MKSLDQCQQRSGLEKTKTWKQKHIVWSGVRRQANVDERDVEEAAKRKTSSEVRGSKAAGRGLQTQAGKWSAAYVRGYDRVRRVDPTGKALRGFGVVQKVFGLCAVPSGPEGDEPMQT